MPNTWITGLSTPTPGRPRTASTPQTGGTAGRAGQLNDELVMVMLAVAVCRKTPFSACPGDG